VYVSLEMHYLCTFEHVKCGADQNTIDDADLNCIQKLICDLYSSGMLCSIDRQVVADVLGQPFGLIFMGPARWADRFSQ
jgi:hypothetical protein